MQRRPPEDYITYLGYNADGELRLAIDLTLFRDYPKEEACAAIDRVGIALLKKHKEATR